MKKFHILVTAVAILLLIFLLVKSSGNGDNKLINSGFGKQALQPTPPPTPVPTPNAPKTFKFDESTDLNAELEKINPQLLDSDFE